MWYTIEYCNKMVWLYELYTTVNMDEVLFWG